MARPQAFDIESLAAAGLAVVGRDGWSALSVRSVASELGVTPMALYRLVADAEELRRLTASAAAPAVRPMAATDPLQDVLRAWAADAYSRLGQYPELASYVILHWTEMADWLDVVERLLTAAEAQGLAGAAAVGTVNAVFAYVLARAQLRDAAAAAPRRVLAPIKSDPARFPLVRASLSEFETRHTDKHFEFGLDALLAGLAR